MISSGWRREKIQLLPQMLQVQCAVPENKPWSHRLSHAKWQGLALERSPRDEAAQGGDNEGLHFSYMFLINLWYLSSQFVQEHFLPECCSGGHNSRLTNRRKAYNMNTFLNHGLYKCPCLWFLHRLLIMKTSLDQHAEKNALLKTRVSDSIQKSEKHS